LIVIFGLFQTVERNATSHCCFLFKLPKQGIMLIRRIKGTNNLETSRSW
jgi:hypothetical protein